jgi:hypothetical protein
LTAANRPRHECPDRGHALAPRDKRVPSFPASPNTLLDSLQQRADRSRRARFDAALDRIPDAEPGPGDRR